MAQTFGDRWQIIADLPEGGQAFPYLVRDLKGSGDTKYVLKRLKNINRLDRFIREIEAIRNLNHENIVKLVDFDLQAEKPYLVTEFCSGGNLNDSPPFWMDDLDIAFELFDQILAGVSHAHNNNIIHRDIKPENIFLRSETGPAVVGDFGICFIEEDGNRLTLVDEAVGPRLFIAPELEDGRVNEVSKKSDVYSLGKLLYWLVSGKTIFSREKHREDNFDLKTRNDNTIYGWENIYLEHVNRILDLMVVEDPDSRRNIENIRILTNRARILVNKEYTPIDKNIPKPCQYCGTGRYLLKAKENIDVRNFGFTPVGNPDWRVFACNECGHIQVFRVDFASQKEWWTP